MMAMESELSTYIGTTVMIVLNENQLTILNQVFRPIFCGTLVDVNGEYALLTNVNIKMNQAPEYIFPTPLALSLDEVAWFMPFDCNTRFSIF